MFWRPAASRPCAAWRQPGNQARSPATRRPGWTPWGWNARCGAGPRAISRSARNSGGRALIGRPAVVIADEPTSALDEDRRAAFLQWLLSACDEAGSTLVFVSHD